MCNDELVASVRDKIDVTTDVSLRDDEAKLCFSLENGERKGIHVEHAKGSLAKPMTKGELEAKFLDQSVGIIDRAKCQEIIKECWQIDAIEDISRLLGLCRTA